MRVFVKRYLVFNSMAAFSRETVRTKTHLVGDESMPRLIPAGVATGEAAYILVDARAGR